MKHSATAKNSVANFQVTVWEPQWPARCACCCGQSDITLLLRMKSEDEDGTVTYDRSWDVPYCQQCALHIHSVRWLNSTLPCLVIAFTIAVVCLIPTDQIDLTRYLSLWLGAASLAFTVAYSVMLYQGKKKMKPTCSCVGPAVLPVKHYDYKGERHTFEFKNATYGNEFRWLNKAHLPTQPSSLTDEQQSTRPSSPHQPPEPPFHSG